MSSLYDFIMKLFYGEAVKCVCCGEMYIPANHPPPTGNQKIINTCSPECFFEQTFM